MVATLNQTGGDGDKVRMEALIALQARAFLADRKITQARSLHSVVAMRRADARGDQAAIRCEEMAAAAALADEVRSLLGTRLVEMLETVGLRILAAPAAGKVPAVKLALKGTVLRSYLEVMTLVPITRPYPGDFTYAPEADGGAGTAVFVVRQHSDDHTGQMLHCSRAGLADVLVMLGMGMLRMDEYQRSGKRLGGNVDVTG